MDGVALCARFSLATSRLEYCGPREAAPVLYAAITGGGEKAPARDLLCRFEALYPYLEAIGSRHGLDPFDERVVEAYWIGNGLLDAFGPEEFLRVLEALVRRGLSPATARRLREHLPAHPLPHHTFHVLFVGVGEVTGHVPTTLTNMESCRVAAGEVVGVEGTTLTLQGRPLGHEGARLFPGPVALRRVPYDPAVLPGVRRGDTVALHWGHPALLLSRAQAEALEHYTARSLAAANEALPGLRALG